MKLHIEYKSGSIEAHLSCTKRPAEFFEHAELSWPDRFNCLLCPDQLVIDQDWQGCTIIFNIEGCKRLLSHMDDAPPGNEASYLTEKELQRFILSVMSMVHHKYTSTRHGSAENFYVFNHLNLIDPELLFVDSSQSIRIISPLFFCSNDVCAMVKRHSFENKNLPPNLNPIESELLVLGQIVYNYIANIPCIGTPILLSDSVVYTVKQNGYSQELGQFLSILLSLQYGNERFWARLLSSSYVDFTFLSPFKFSSFKSDDMVDSSVSEDLGPNSAEIPNDKLKSFFIAAQSLCNNTPHGQNCNTDTLMTLLTNKVTIAGIIDHIYTLSKANDGCSSNIFSTDVSDVIFGYDDCLSIFVVILRHDFQTFTLQEVILQDVDLTQRLLSLPINPSQNYLKTFNCIVTSLLFTRKSTFLLLSAYARHINLFEQLISNIHYEEITGTLLTLIDACSQFNDDEINTKIVYCASQANLCNRLIAAAFSQECVSILLPTMYLYEKLFSSSIPGLLALAVSGLPSILTMLNLYATDLHATREITADMSLFVCTCFSECSKLLSMGMSLIFKMALSALTTSLNLALKDSLLHGEIEIVYPSIIYRIGFLTERLVHFVSEMTSSYPTITINVHTQRYITYLYHYLMFYARVFSVTADLKSYIYFKRTGTKHVDEFNRKTIQREPLQRPVAELLLEVPIPYSAQAGSGGPSEIPISTTYLLEDGTPLPISLRMLALDLLNAELIKGMCKLFYSYPNSTTLHFAVGRILIPYIELFICEPDILDNICLQSSFIDVGQEFVKLVNLDRNSWSSGLIHYANLFRNIVRFAGGVSDKTLFTVDWRQLRPNIFERISNLIPFSIKRLTTITTAHELNPTIKYLLQAGAMTDLSARILDHSYDLLLSKVSRQADINIDDFTDSSTVIEFTVPYTESMFTGAIVTGVTPLPMEVSTQVGENDCLPFIEDLVTSDYDASTLDDT